MGEICDFWLKNYGKKWSRKNVFEIPMLYVKLDFT